MGLFRRLSDQAPTTAAAGVAVERSWREVALACVAAGFLLWSAFLAARSPVGAWEISVFRSINGLPDWLFPILWPFMQYGVFVTIPLAASLAAITKHYRLAVLLLVGGVGIYLAARVLKDAVERGRPADLLAILVYERERFAPGSLGYPSGHSAVAGTIATFAHFYLGRVWKVASIATLLIVLVGRIYVGAHLPLDMVGGLALGVATASLANFVFGVPRRDAPAASSAVDGAEDVPDTAH